MGRKHKILYLGWIGFNNVGDEWMWQMFRSMSDQYLDPNRYEVIPSLPGVDIKDVAAYDTIVLGGGSLIIPGYVDILHQAASLGKQTVIWGSGHDRLSRLLPHPQGGYEPDGALESGEYRAKLQEAIRSAAYCGVRGPWTYRYLEELGVPMSGVHVSGDSAMLADLPEQGKVKPELLGGGEKWVAINWGTSFNRIYGNNEAAVEEEFVQTARSLIAQGYHLYFYVVWGPDRQAALRLYEKIGLPAQTVYDPLVRSYQDYMDILRACEFTINFKLHANILSAAANVPFICLGYRFKSFDFAHSLQTPHMIVPTNAEHLSASLDSLVGTAQAERERIVANFEKLRRHARQQLAVPFQQLFV